jgi:adenylate kinase
VLKQRLAAYRDQTTPLIAYYRDRGTLRSVDGMAPIADVTVAIDKALSAPPGPGKKSQNESADATSKRTGPRAVLARRPAATRRGKRRKGS